MHAKLRSRLIVGLIAVTLSTSGCATKEENFLLAGAVLLGAAAVYGAKHGAYAGGGGGTASDYDWAWDEFYNRGVLVWACRGMQTGQFAEQTRCTYKPKNDYTWPAKYL
jgi:hypothetical protein